MNTLKKAKLIATGLFVLMVVLFIFSSIYEKNFPFLVYIRAFSEAAMVGALADWFAVVALFRYPLGLKIPHTAIIPKNKDRIGENLALFVREEFLTEAVISPKIEKTNISLKLADKLSDKVFVSRMVENISDYIPEIIQKLEDSDVKLFLQENIIEKLKKINLSSSLGSILEFIFSNGKDKLIIDEVINISIGLLNNNEDKIKDLIKKESPWWIPSFVDNSVYKKLITRIKEYLDELKNNEESENRKKIILKINKLIQDLKSSPEFHKKSEEIKQKIFNDEVVNDVLSKLIEDLKIKILNDLQSENSVIKQKTTEFVLSLGASFSKDMALQLKLNKWIKDFSVNVLVSNAASISSVISDTFKSWDAEEVSTKLENQVGKDLQFIRINGTIIGGLVGLLIYFFSTLLN